MGRMHRIAQPRGQRTDERSRDSVEINTSSAVGDLFPADAGMQRPVCDPGVNSPTSTSLKWGADGELADLDLHNIVARLCLHDQQVCPCLDDGPEPE